MHSRTSQFTIEGSSMKANQNAPAFATSEIEIRAPPEVVWDVLTDFQRWPSWNSNVQSVKGGGSVSKGTTFKWKSGGSTIRSTIQEVERPTLIAWTGSLMAIKAIHVWHFTSREGRTLVSTEESFDGPIARLFKRSLQRTLEESLASGLKDLKTEAEKRPVKKRSLGAQSNTKG
jgi:carbon monoxide dehydrogenase subunit G